MCGQNGVFPFVSWFMRQSNCSAPIPSGKITFFWLVPLSLYFFPNKWLISPFSRVTRPFISHAFLSDPGAAPGRGGGGGRTILPAHKVSISRQWNVFDSGYCLCKRCIYHIKVLSRLWQWTIRRLGGWVRSLSSIRR